MVYKAEDTRLGRFVALKFLPPEGQRDAHALARFQREAQAASALNHHNICTVYDTGEQDGQTFIAMELLEGQTLKQKIASRALPLETLLDYAMQITAALEIAHKNGIVHRDVKPSNIFVTSRGEVKLADFGLAKRVMLDSVPIGEAPTISSPITERGAIVGTLAYMSPEQAQDKDIDARSDIFSFGIVLYEMATGKRAFPGESPVTIIGEILHKEPKPIRELNPQVPEELQRIVGKTLEKDREDRYQTAHELMVDLRRLMKKETERSQTGLAAELAKPANWRKWIWIGAAAVLCAALWVALTGRGAPADSSPLPMVQLTFSSEPENSPDRHGRIAHLFLHRTRSGGNVRQGRSPGASPRSDRNYEHPGYFAGWFRVFAGAERPERRNTAGNHLEHARAGRCGEAFGECDGARRKLFAGREVDCVQ